MAPFVVVLDVIYPVVVVVDLAIAVVVSSDVITCCGRRDSCAIDVGYFVLPSVIFIMPHILIHQVEVVGDHGAS